MAPTGCRVFWPWKSRRHGSPRFPLQEQADGYRYSAFCAHYRDWLARQRLSMRQGHNAGEKLFVDDFGKKPEIVEAATGAVRPVELFVAVLGASNYTYAEATETQRSADFIQSHGRAVEYLGGVPVAIVPDQLKTGIHDACRYEPILQRTYEEWRRSRQPRNCARSRQVSAR